jgi:hypothetical protein
VLALNTNAPAERQCLLMALFLLKSAYSCLL